MSRWTDPARRTLDDLAFARLFHSLRPRGWNSDGRYELRGAELTITPDRRDRGASKYRVRIYDEYVLGRWTRAMSLLDENAKPALEAQYMRIEDSR